ncbi:helix-turn-helix domain-containing protein [Tsuneonella sp. HG249]
MLDRMFVEENTLGGRIRQARHAHRWSLETLAGKLGISKVSVWGWEMDRSRPRLQMLGRLSEILEIPVEILLNGADKARTGHSVASLLESHQHSIAKALGVPAEQVAIKVTLGTGRSEEADRESAE